MRSLINGLILTFIAAILCCCSTTRNISADQQDNRSSYVKELEGASHNQIVRTNIDEENSPGHARTANWVGISFLCLPAVVALIGFLAIP